MQRRSGPVTSDDLQVFERMDIGRTLKVVITTPNESAYATSVLKVFTKGSPLPLQQCIEAFNSFGLKLEDYRVSETADGVGENRCIQYFIPGNSTLDEVSHARAAELSSAIEESLTGHSPCDRFSRLMFAAGLSPRETTLLRAYFGYLRQIGTPFSEDVVATVLVDHPTATQALIAWFHARFTPGLSDRTTAEEVSARHLQQLISDIAAKDVQCVLSAFQELIGATLRTNFYGADASGAPRSHLALKFDCAAIAGLPPPKPLYEIFVFSPRMEGIHLRGGKVARGGIRWSDRLHDFRTEVHGLFKAQMVKNVVIVPEGAKGGFVIKQPPTAGGDALRREAIECYSTLIRGLLDLTDNLIDGAVVPPADVVRRDGDDPYLVVAADKGTATFSDIANGISQDYGFWLGDAFASGGSVGYDHKKLGITARGAWEAVKRHFRELGVDVHTEPIDVVGVGDMSGDVFGNGLLRSPFMRLLGAFDHRHIFVDPEPDVVAAHMERQRLFSLPASSWADFDPSALGPGGAVYSRTATEIELSPQAQARFGLPARTTPQQLQRALLAAPVDLLWLGGIGSYVRASDETDAAVGDRANDAVRIEARTLRCRVVGEGANLGFTQRGRIEAAQHGVRLNTDAIDNAGGVSCSDHEVNIKILLDAIEKTGALPRERRNDLLAAMADDVCSMVLDDVRLQTQALSIAEARAGRDLDRHLRLMQFFDQRGQLDRIVAGLPDDETLLERRSRKQGLTRPELAALLAHTKIALFGEFIQSTLPDDPLLESDLLAYFPQRLQQDFRAQILAHPLRREILTTAVVNSMVNRVGSGFVNDIQEQTGAQDADVARAYLVARELFGLEACWRQIETLDTAGTSESHLAMLLASREIVELATLWVLRNHPLPIDISATVASLTPRLATGFSALSEWREGRLGRAREERHRQWVEAGAPEALADRMATLWLAAANLDLIALDSGAIEMASLLRLADAVDDELGLSNLRETLLAIPCHTPAEGSALAYLLDTVTSAPARLISHNAGDLRQAAAPGRWLAQVLANRKAAVSLYGMRRRSIAQRHQDMAEAMLTTAALEGIIDHAC